MANDRSNFFSFALTMSSDSLFYTMIIPTQKKSARASTLELGINKSDLPRVFTTLLSVKSLRYECQQNWEAFYNTSANLLLDDEVLIETCVLTFITKTFSHLPLFRPNSLLY